MAITIPPLPPAPPPLGTTYDQVLWNAHWSYADLLLRVEQAKALEIERAAIQIRHDECIAVQKETAAAIRGDVSKPVPFPL